MLLWIWRRCRSFLKGGRKRCGRSGSCVRRASVRVEGVLLVLPSSYSITPPSGEGDSLQQMVGGMKWHRKERMGITGPLLLIHLTVGLSFSRLPLQPCPVYAF